MIERKGLPHETLIDSKKYEETLVRRYDFRFSRSLFPFFLLFIPRRPFLYSNASPLFSSYTRLSGVSLHSKPQPQPKSQVQVSRAAYPECTPAPARPLVLSHVQCQLSLPALLLSPPRTDLLTRACCTLYCIVILCFFSPPESVCCWLDTWVRGSRYTRTSALFSLQRQLQGGGQMIATQRIYSVVRTRSPPARVGSPILSNHTASSFLPVLALHNSQVARHGRQYFNVDTTCSKNECINNV